LIIQKKILLLRIIKKKIAMEYKEILSLYDRVQTKAKTSKDLEVIRCFGVELGRQILSNIKLNTGLEYGWFKVTTLTNFPNFIARANDFLEDKNFNMLVKKLDDSKYHVKSEEGKSLGVFTEEYLLCDRDSPFHIHGILKKECGEKKEVVLYYCCKLELYLSKVN
jgi:hypothetical protein